MNEKNVKTSVKKHLSQLSPRSRRIIRYSIIVLCVFGLSFQTTKLFIQYSKGQTVVNMKPLFDEYKAMLKNMTEDDLKNVTLRQHLESIYKNFSMFTYYQANIRELFDLSIPFHLLRNENYSKKTDPEVPISINVWGMRLYSNGSVQHIKLSDTTPVQSVQYHDFGDGDYKCFTFFSHLNETFREIQIDIQ